MNNNIIIRKGTEKDLPQVHDLIVELAIYEKAQNEVKNTVDQMSIDGFGSNPIFGLFVAENSLDNKIVGIALYYYRYSTWKGKRLYLEDLVVSESQRGSGTGKKLMDQTIAFAKESGCTGMMWQALDWNEPALNFYKKYGAKFDEEWVNCHLDF